MNPMSLEQRAKCHVIIHIASASAGVVGAGLTQTTRSDAAVITPIQMAMASSLGFVFGIEISESSARAAVASATASIVGRSMSQFLVGCIPLAGNAINACTAAALTETIGWMMAEEFSHGHPLVLTP